MSIRPKAWARSFWREPWPEQPMALVSEAGNGRVRNTTIKQLEPKATTNEYLEAPKERSNRPLLRSLSGAAERLLRVFRLVLLSWISSSTSSWLLQGRLCANICYHTKMRLPSAQAGSACCVRHCCLSKTKTSKRAGRSSLSRFCQDWRSELSRSS